MIFLFFFEIVYYNHYTKYLNIMIGKLLISTGYPLSNGVPSEVIDLENPSNICENLPDFPITVEGSVGGLIQNDIPLICGGWNITHNMKCYSIGAKENLEVNLIQRRHYSGGIIINNNLWITGGISPKTSEFILSNGTSIEGPKLPIDLLYHCATKINDSFVLLTGGADTMGQVLIVDAEQNFKMEKGPSLLTERHSHACGTFIHQEKLWVVVVGGTNGYDILNTTELWDPSSDQGWIKGISFLQQLGK